MHKLKTQPFLLSMFAMLCVGVTMQYGLWISHQGDAAYHAIVDMPVTAPADGKCQTYIESYNGKLVCFKDWKLQHQKLMVGAL